MEPAAAATAGIYCQQCGYDLRGSVGAAGEPCRCPECGRAFSPGDFKTFRTRPLVPWKRAMGRWARRAAILLLALGILLGGPWGWFYLGWRQEQAVLAQVRATGVNYQPVVRGGAPGRWLCGRHIPGSFVLERRRGVVLPATATDADLLPLQKLPELERLWVHGPITDAGLVHLARCPRLTTLSLRETRVTDAGLVALAKLPALRFLDLRDTRITDAGLVTLARLPALRFLDLRGTRVTDAGLVYLAKHAALEQLDLSRTDISDAGLVRLEKLRPLPILILLETRVTPAGVARLQAALPGRTIVGP